MSVSKLNILKGRVVSLRTHGNVTFIDVGVETKVVNCISSLNETKNYDHVKNLFLGALVELLVLDSLKPKKYHMKTVHEVLSITERGVFPKEYPKNNVQDVEIRYKERPLDLLSNRSSFELLKKRFHIISDVREFFKEKNFLEVDTPILEPTYGGAIANPFTTYANFNKRTYYLRIAPEFNLKKLIIGGFKDVFEIGPVFRNEDIDRTHTCEYTSMEFYTTSYSYEEVLGFVESLYHRLTLKYTNSSIRENFDLSKNWPVYNKEEIDELLQKHNLKHVDQLMDAKLLGPFFHLEGIENTPLGVFPYIFESYVDYNVELTTGYIEQRDPKEILKITKELQYPPVDPSFLKSLEYGLPYTVGCGIGVDRLVQSVCNSKTIRDIQSFPKL